MKFWRSSSKNSIWEEKKNNNGSSRMKSFFQFFTKKSFFSPKKKFLPPIQSPHKPRVPMPIQTAILLEEKINEVCTTSTTSPEPVKKSPSVVAKLMGLDLPAPPQKTPEPTLDSTQKKPSEFPLPKLANNTSQTVQDKLSQALSPNLGTTSKLEQPVPSKAATLRSVQKIESPVLKPLIHNGLKLEQLNTEMHPTRPVKSPPRSLSPMNNAKLLEATAMLLDIGSQPIKSRAVTASRSELQNPVIEKFGSKLNNALVNLDGLKNVNSTTNNKIKANEEVNVGGKETGTKRDVSPKKGVNTTETKNDAQKLIANGRNTQENSSVKIPTRQNNIKLNRIPLNNAPKDFIALNRSLIKTTPLRKKNNGLEKKHENKRPVKKVRPTDFSKKSGDAKVGKIDGGNEKRGGKELLISKGVGLINEKPPDSKNRAGEEEEMCIVSFTFSSPMKHSNKYTSSSDLEGRTDSGLTESSVSSSVLLDDGRDLYSYRDMRISPTTIHQGPSLSDELVSVRSNGLSDPKLDVDKKGTSAKEIEDEKILTEKNFAPTSTSSETSEKKNNKISHRIGPPRNRQRKTLYGTSKIELLLQNVVFSNQNSVQQVSSYLDETTKSILKASYKVTNNSKDVDQQKEVIADFVTEHLYLIQSKVLNCGYKSWKNFKIFYTKERIVKEIEKEIVEIETLVGKELEVLIGKDMENWMDSRVNFEIGSQIEKEIFSQLITEVVRDFFT